MALMKSCERCVHRKVCDLHTSVCLALADCPLRIHADRVALLKGISLALADACQEYAGPTEEAGNDS